VAKNKEQLTKSKAIAESGSPFRLPTMSATEACSDYLREQIISGEIPHGSNIVIDRVAAQIGVSHTPVREAVRRLEAEGLLSYRANRGATVRPLGVREFEELILIRKTLEPALLSKAIECAEPGSFQIAKAKLETWKKATGSKEILQCGWEFMRATYVPSGLHRCLDIVDANWALLVRYHRHSWNPSKEASAGDLENMRRILAACRDRDPQEAIEALKASVDWGTEIVRQQLEGSPKSEKL
jgi:DNA-binding GntR family transcriptional regulator